MDVLELTAVSAIVLDLLSGFQRPSRYRPTAPAEPAVVRVLERLRQADPQTGPPMRLHAGGRLLPDGRSPVNFQWIRDVAPEGHLRQTGGCGLWRGRGKYAPCRTLSIASWRPRAPLWRLRPGLGNPRASLPERRPSPARLGKRQPHTIQADPPAAAAFRHQNGPEVLQGAVYIVVHHHVLIQSHLS